MKQINHKNSEGIQDENPFQLLGKKTTHFIVKKYVNREKKSPSKKYLKKNLNEGRWSYTEQIKFIKALSQNGPNWKKISETINNRTPTQIRSHAQKFYQRLKKCKNNELGIDFTTNSIRNFKDMINHIKSVNSKNDINNIFLYLSDINQKSLDELSKNANAKELPHFVAAIASCAYEEMINRQNEFLNKNKINISNNNTQIFNKNNYKFDSNNMNNILLLDSLNNMNNLSVVLLSYLSKSIRTNNLINILNYNCLENINKALSNVTQLSSIINAQSSLNNSNIKEIKNNTDDL